MSTATDRRPGPRGGLLFTPATAPFPLPRAGVPDAGSVRVGPAGRPPREIERCFGGAWHGVDWPARLWQLLAGADERGVDLVTRAAMLDLPARTYVSSTDVARALSALPPAYARRRD